MKVLFAHQHPFSIAHGGTQGVIEALLRELPEQGIEVECEAWWDGRQQGDILHYFGRPLDLNIRLAQAVGRKIVMTEFLDTTAARAPVALLAQRILMRLARACLPGLTGRLGWEIYRSGDALVYATEHDRQVACKIFGAPRHKTHVISHGLEANVLRELARPEPAEDFLLCVASIQERKNVCLLAEAAHRAAVPVVFIGRPLATGDDTYLERFRTMVDGRTVRWVQHAGEEEKWSFLRRAKGFVLLSDAESGCLAVYEAAAAGLPMLLAGRPWSRSACASFSAVETTSLSPAKIVTRLSDFYRRSRRTPGCHQVPSWGNVSSRYVDLYRAVLNNTGTPDGG